MIDETNKRETEIRQAMHEASTLTATKRNLRNDASNALTALGAEPDPADFDTMEDWQALHGPWKFNHAKAAKALNIATAESEAASIAERDTLATLQLELDEMARQRSIAAATEAMKHLGDATNAFAEAVRNYEAALAAVPGADQERFWFSNSPAFPIRSCQAQRLYDDYRIEPVISVPFQA